MNISVFGLGYVGCVTIACLAKSGHNVIGVDINRGKVEMLRAGKSPIIEKGLEELIGEGRGNGRIQVTTDYLEAILATEVSLVCVGTPSNGNGSLDLRGVQTVSQQIGESLKKKNAYHCMVIRSTVLPGTVRDILVPTVAASSGKRVHKDFDVCFHPEFLREGSSIADFYSPPFTVIGQETERGGDMVAQIYQGIEIPITKTSYEVAEMLKYACNSFHALKITFANEIGALCKTLDIDSHAVMDLFTLDEKLNISRAYLRPGFAFGGSCLPKDLRALLKKAREVDLEVPVLSAILDSNRLNVQRAVEWILRTKQKKIGILGLSFKEGTDDLRESPMVTLVEALLGKGLHVKIYDSDASLAKIFGANREFILREIPHISSLMCPNVDEAIRGSEVIVVGKSEGQFMPALEPYLGKKTIFDLVRITTTTPATLENYEGICW